MCASDFLCVHLWIQDRVSAMGKVFPGTFSATGLYLICCSRKTLPSQRNVVETPIVDKWHWWLTMCLKAELIQATKIFLKFFAGLHASQTLFLNLCIARFRQMPKAVSYWIPLSLELEKHNSKSKAIGIDRLQGLATS